MMFQDYQLLIIKYCNHGFVSSFKSSVHGQLLFIFSFSVEDDLSQEFLALLSILVGGLGK